MFLFISKIYHKKCGLTNFSNVLILFTKLTVCFTSRIELFLTRLQHARCRLQWNVRRAETWEMSEFRTQRVEMFVKYMIYVTNKHRRKKVLVNFGYKHKIWVKLRSQRKSLSFSNTRRTRKDWICYYKISYYVLH